MADQNQTTAERDRDKDGDCMLCGARDDQECGCDQTETTDAASPEWETDCLRWRGRVLTGKHAHWCFDWDGLPVDETCDEFHSCTCTGKDAPHAKPI